MQSPSNLAAIYLVTMTALAARLTTTIVYRKPSGVIQVRPIKPTSIETCKNGNTIVRALCALTDEPRSFSLARIEDAKLGDLVTDRAILLP